MLHELIQKAIWEDYAPKVERKGKDGEKQSVPDPDTLYVGPFIDGLAKFLGRDIGRALGFRDTDPSNYRRYIKVLLHDAANDPRRAQHTWHGLKFSMKRAGWSGALVLSERAIDEEPGTIMNTVYVREDYETGVSEVVTFKNSKTDELVAGRPIIRTDKRWGLYYLKRGDEFELFFRDRYNNPIQLNWRLRPLDEGESLIRQNEATGEARF